VAAVLGLADDVAVRRIVIHQEEADALTGVVSQDGAQAHGGAVGCQVQSNKLVAAEIDRAGFQKHALAAEVPGQVVPHKTDAAHVLPQATLDSRTQTVFHNYACCTTLLPGYSGVGEGDPSGAASGGDDVASLNYSRTRPRTHL
jgi:hypothetical protein